MNTTTDTNWEIIRAAMLEAALGEYGVAEIKGSKHNPRILQYAKDVGMNWVKTDETAWCSIFMNWVVAQTGLKGTKKPNARSWLTWGIETNDPKPGDLVVFWREKRTSWKGHVAMFIRETETHVYVLGGNQGNRVCIMPYPKYRVLDYRTIVD